MASQDVQIVDYVFNVNGWSFKLDKVPEYSELYAFTPSTTHFRDAIATAKNTGGSPLRSSLDLTAREQDAAGELNIEKYLLVGFTHDGLPESSCKPHPGKKSRRPIGIELLQPQITISTLPIPVVTRILGYHPGGVKLWALLNPREDLCTPYAIAQKYVFYLSEYRDNTTQTRILGRSWNQLLLGSALLPSARLASEEEIKGRRITVTAEDLLEPPESLVNEIASLIEALESKGTWHVDEIESIILQAEEDLKYMPPPSCPRTRQFTDSTCIFSEDGKDAHEMVIEFMFMVPKALDITGESLSILKRSLVQSRIVLKYSQLQAFVREGCFQVKTLISERQVDKDITTLARGVMEVVERNAQPSSKPTALISKHTEDLLFVILISLRNIMAAVEEYDLEPTNGVRNINTIDVDYNRESDSDIINARSAAYKRLARSTAVQYLAAYHAQKRMSKDIVKEMMISVLGDLGLDLKQREYA